MNGYAKCMKMSYNGEIKRAKLPENFEGLKSVLSQAFSLKLCLFMMISLSFLIP